MPRFFMVRPGQKSFSEWVHREDREGREERPKGLSSTPVPIVVEESGTPTSPEAPKKTALALAFDQAADAKAAFRLLTDAYDEAASKITGGNFRDTLELCDKVITRWPDSDESLEARKLIWRCYTQMPEHEVARIVFLTYANEAGERARQTLLARNAGSRRWHDGNPSRNAGIRPPPYSSMPSRAGVPWAK